MSYNVVYNMEHYPSFKFTDPDQTLTLKKKNDKKNTENIFYFMELSYIYIDKPFLFGFRMLLSVLLISFKSKN